MDTNLYLEIIKDIRNDLENYIKKYNLKSLVLGLSGGIDSAVCAGLAKPICDKLGIQLIGISLPIETNKKEEIDRAEKIGKYFCTKFCDKGDQIIRWFNLIEQDVRSCCFPFVLEDDKFNKFISDNYKFKINLGNIKARLRMVFLYHVASINEGLVLSTDNFTEYLLGFWTLHGDVGDYGMIANLWKTEVYKVARLLCLEVDNEARNAMEECINAIPTDGLGIAESDFEQLGVDSYEEIDEILDQVHFNREWYLEHKGDEMWESPVVKRYFSTEFKRENPYNVVIER